jgi:hypothetical protein
VQLCLGRTGTRNALTADALAIPECNVLTAMTAVVRGRFHCDNVERLNFLRGDTYRRMLREEEHITLSLALDQALDCNPTADETSW